MSIRFDLSEPSRASLTLAPNYGLSELADTYRLEAPHILDIDKRSELGQFYTPASIAQFMASLITPTSKINLLDAGAGAGALTAAVVEAALAWTKRPKEICVTAYEVDDAAISLLRSTLNECYQVCRTHGVEFKSKIIHADFIEKVTEAASGQLKLFDSSAVPCNIAILNPPYRRINSDSPERLALRRAGIETSNLYAAFVWLSSKLLSADGQLVAITPRSFCNGPYFTPFRKALLKDFRFEHIHIFESRDHVFRDDEVLQENVIYKLTKSKETKKVTISTSMGETDELITERVTSHEDIVRLSDHEMFIHIVPDEAGAQISQTARSLDYSLEDLGLSVSTGRVVDFRAREALRNSPEVNGSVPLVYPQHFADGMIDWPKAHAKKPNAIIHNTETDGLLIPNNYYVLVKRFSAKEEKRRVVAALVRPEQFESKFIGIENHLNYFHARGQGLSKDVAQGLTLFLNSQLVDQYFRQFNGHTQVNAADLKKLRYPGLDQLRQMALRAQNGEGKEQDAEELNIMANTERILNKTQRHQNIQDALQIIRLLNLPREQQNDRSALTLLALLDIKPDSKWSQASAPMRGITEIMDFARERYGLRYAPNTRETFRRFTMHQFVQAGIAVANPDSPQRPTNSPNYCYQVEPEALKLFQSYGTKKWKARLSAYVSASNSLQTLQAQERSMSFLPVQLPNGSDVKLSGGGQNPLIKKIIEEFCPRFTPGGVVVYMGDTRQKVRGDEISYLRGLGISIDRHGKMPDVIIHFTKKNWLVIIEAVTSHGPISIKRHNELKDLFRENKAGLVFVTAFESRQIFARYLKEIAWETDVWIAAAPSHLIHFNGERFLGPY